MRDEWQIYCSDHGPGVQWLQHGQNVREFNLLVPGWTVRVRCKQNPNKNYIKTTCNTSQLSKSIRSKESKGSYSNLRYLDSGCHDTMEATTMCYTSCAEPILFMGVGTWNFGKASKSVGLIIIIVIVPTDPLIYAHCGRKSMQITTFKHTQRESESVQISFQHIRWFLLKKI